MNLLRKVWVMLIVTVVASCSSETYDLVSPDKDLKVVVQTTGDNSLGEIGFTVEYKGKCILPYAKLGLETDHQNFGGNLILKSVSKAQPIVDDYEMKTGKRSHCINRASERVYYLENDKEQTLEVTFRVYNDGVALKYKLNAVSDEEHIVNEFTTYAVPQGTKRWMQQYDPGYERFYPLSTDGKLASDPNSVLWGYPALIESQDSIFMLITEANIRRDHCGSFLYNGINRDHYQVRMADEKLAFRNSWESPWRLLIIGELSDIVESTLVTDVADPSKIEHTDWIIPGMAAWIYWANNHGTKNFEIVKEYIDLAVEMKWPYDLIDWEWDVMENGGNIQDAVKYALEKGIKPLLWYNSSTSWVGTGAPGPLFRLNEKESREKEYKWLGEMGVSGLKIDFFPDDGASTMNYYMDLLEDAVKYKLMINFHGATIPRGWQRTYPNMMSVEGVYGAEWYNNAPVLTNRAAGHNATLPFTRNVVGSMDYTPGTFSDSQHPHITSHGHELALPVIFESALQHMPDRPSTYCSLPKQVKSFLSVLPTAWDDTKLLSGYPGVEVIIARRKGNTWYIGGINGTNEERILRFTLDVLPNVGGKMTIFKDGTDDRSFSIEENILLSKRDKNIEVKSLPRGGFAAVIE